LGGLLVFCGRCWGGCWSRNLHKRLRRPFWMIFGCVFDMWWWLFWFMMVAFEDDLLEIGCSVCVRMRNELDWQFDKGSSLSINSWSIRSRKFSSMESIFFDGILGKWRMTSVTTFASPSDQWANRPCQCSSLSFSTPQLQKVIQSFGTTSIIDQPVGTNALARYVI